MIRTLFFDFGNVLGRFDHWRSVVRLAKHTNLTPRELYDLILENDLEDAFEHGTLTARQYAEEAIRRGQLTCSVEQFTEMFQDIFTLNTDVLDHIPQLARRYRLLLASNTNAIHFDHYCRQFEPYLRHFAALPTSHQAGYRKPQPGFFAYCQGFADAEPSECAFIDDLEINVNAGNRHGWRAIHYVPGNDFRAKLRDAGIEWD